MFVGMNAGTLGHRWLMTDKGTEAGNTGAPDPEAEAAAAAAAAKAAGEPTLDDLLKDLPDAVKSHYGKIISNARTEGQTKAQEKIDAAKAAADEAAALEVKKKAGDFEAVETTLKGQVASVTADRDTLKERNDKLNAAMSTRIEELKKGLNDVQLEGFPADGDALDQIEFLEGRIAWLAKLGSDGERKRGTSKETPDRSSKKTGDVEQEELKRITKNGTYSV